MIRLGFDYKEVFVINAMEQRKGHDKQHENKENLETDCYRYMNLLHSNSSFYWFKYCSENRFSCVLPFFDHDGISVCWLWYDKSGVMFCDRAV